MAGMSSEHDQISSFEFRPEHEYRWQRLFVGCLAKCEVQRARLWVSTYDPVAAERLGNAAVEAFSCTFWVAGNARERLRLSLRSSADMYLKLYNLPADREISPPAFTVVRSANRWARDLVTWRSFGLGGMSTFECCLEVLNWAFNGALASDVRDLKSQMKQSWGKARAALRSTPPEPAPTSKRKAKKPKNKASNGLKYRLGVNQNGGQLWPYHWSEAYPVYVPSFFCNFFSPPFCPAQSTGKPEADDVAACNFSPPFCPAQNTDKPEEDDADVSVEGDDMSIPGTDISALFRQPDLMRNHQVSRSNCSDKGSQDGMGDRLSIPDTLEGSSVFQYQPGARPGLAGRLPKKQPSKRGSLPPGLESIADEDGSGFEASSEGMELPTYVCEDCHREDSRGWHARDGYWCMPCWEKWYQKKHDKEEVVPEKWLRLVHLLLGEEPSTHPPESVSTLQKYDMMEPIYCEQHFQTEVRVTSMCCLTAACVGSPGMCVVALHPAIVIKNKSPGPKSQSWPLSALRERTSFKDAIQEEVVPRWGGIYLPELVVSKDEFGEAASPVCVPLVWGSPPWKPKNDAKSVAEFREEMRKKIINILRICYVHGHQELVISATFQALPAREIAALFHELLITGSGDTVGAFRRVIFALPKEEVPAKVLLSFQEEFRYSERRGKLDLSWKDGKYLVPRIQPDVCLDANVRDVKLKDVNGNRTHAFSRVVSSSREHQLWSLLPCGRIVLAAVPQLCLSAADSRAGAAVHMWRKLEADNKHAPLQIWQMTSDGRITLGSHPQLQLCLPQGSHAQLREEGADPALWSWWPQVEPESSS